MSISYNPAIPNPPNSPSADVTVMQSNAAAISNIISVDHVGFNVLHGGEHKQVTFSNIAAPSTPTDPTSVLYTQNDAFSHPQLKFLNSTNSTQSSMTNGSMVLFGGLIIKWGIGSIPTNTPTGISFPVAFPNACLSVVVTSRNHGNTPGTFDVNSVSPSSFTLYAVTSGNFYYIALGN